MVYWSNREKGREERIMAWKLKKTDVSKEFSRKAQKKRVKRNLKRKLRGKGSGYVN